MSARCRTEVGLKAVEDYLEKNDIEVDAVMKEKPPAKCYIDDRAICFNPTGNGEIYREDYLSNILKAQIENFKPWHKQQSLLHDIIFNDNSDNARLKEYVNNTSKELRNASQIRRNPEKIAEILDRIDYEGFYNAFYLVQQKIEQEAFLAVEGKDTFAPHVMCSGALSNGTNLEKIELLGQLKSYIIICEAQYRFLVKIYSLREKIRTHYMRDICDNVCKELKGFGVGVSLDNVIHHINANINALLDVIIALYEVQLIRVTMDGVDVSNVYACLWDPDIEMNSIEISSEFANNLLLAIDDAGSIFNYKIRR